VNAKLLALLARVRPPDFETAVCAHRGASGAAPENTVAAFKGAIAAGCDIVELDVLVTKDLELAVVHDEKLGRTTDRKGAVAALTLDELRACDAGRWFGEAWAGERIPHLAEALGAIERKAVPMIELKQKAAKVPALVPALAKAITVEGYHDRAIVICWDDATARAVREALPGVLIARIAFTRLGIRRAVKNGFDGVVPWRASATRRFLDEARASGIFVAPWTVNRTKDMEFFARHGCDAIITDHPEMLRLRLALEAKAKADAKVAQARAALLAIEAKAPETGASAEETAADARASVAPATLGAPAAGEAGLANEGPAASEPSLDVTPRTPVEAQPAA